MAITRSPSTPLLVLLLLLVVAAGAAAWWLARQDPEPRSPAVDAPEAAPADPAAPARRGADGTGAARAAAPATSFAVTWRGYAPEPDEPLQVLWFDPRAMAAAPLYATLWERWQAEDGELFRELLRRSGGRPPWPSGVLSGDAAGSVRSEAIPPGSWRAVVLGPAGREDSLDFVLRAGEPCQLVREWPAPVGLRVRVEGSVVDAGSGRPLPDAVVFAVPILCTVEEMAALTEEGLRSARARPDGGFVLPMHFPPRANLRVVKAVYQGFFPAVRWLEDRIAGADGRIPGVDFALHPLDSAARVRGRVTDPSGAAVKARVSLRDTAGQELVARQRVAGVLAADADAEGRFELGSVPPGTFAVAVERAGFAPWTRAGLALAARSTTDLGTIVLVPSAGTAGEAVFTGTVADAAGAPVTGAAITAGTMRGRSDERGAFRVEKIPPGRQEVALEAAGFPVARLWIDFAPGATVEHHHRFPGGTHFLAGTVLDGDRTLPGIEVVARARLPRVPGGPLPPAADRGRLEWRARTDASGKFRIERLPAAAIDLHLYWDQPYADLFVAAVALDRDDHVFRFPFPRAAGIEGVVRAASGAPLPGAVVAVITQEAAAARATSGADGSYRIEVRLTHQQATRVACSKSGFATAEASFVRAQNPGERGPALRWDPILFGEPELAQVSGRVTDPGGRPVAGVWCRFHEPAPAQGGAAGRTRWSATATTDSEGKFACAGLMPGTVAAEFQSPRHETAARTFEATAAARVLLDVTMEPVAVAEFRVHVLAPGGGAAADTPFAAVCAGPDRFVEGRTDAQGELRLRDWPTAETELRFPSVPACPETHCRITPVQGPGGEARLYFLRLRAGHGLVRGVVRTSRGLPVPAAFVFLREDGATVRVVENTATDREGRFVFAHLPAGSYEISLRGEAGSWQAVRPDGPDVVLVDDT